MKNGRGRKVPLEPHLSEEEREAWLAGQYVDLRKHRLGIPGISTDRAVGYIKVGRKQSLMGDRTSEALNSRFFLLTLLQILPPPYKIKPFFVVESLSLLL